MLLQDGFPEKRSRAAGIFDYLTGGLAALASLMLLAALWQIAAEHLGSLMLPPPLPVLQKAAALFQENAGRAAWLTTLKSVALGTLLALALGIGGGWLAGQSRTAAVLLRPWITVLLGTPPIIWVVLGLFWFSQGAAVTLFTIACAITPMLFAAGMMSILSRPQPLLDMAKTYRFGCRRTLQHVWLPHLCQVLMPAVIVAAGSAVKLAVMAELLGGTAGIGAKISDARAMLATEDVLAWVVLIIAIIMTVEYGLLEPLKRWVLPDAARRS